MIKSDRLKKPRSWKEAEALPFLTIEKDPYSEDDEMNIFVQLENGIDNPVTGETGGGFYVADFNDFLSQGFGWWR